MPDELPDDEPLDEELDEDAPTDAVSAEPPHAPSSADSATKATQDWTRSESVLRSEFIGLIILPQEAATDSAGALQGQTISLVAGHRSLRFDRREAP